MGWNHQLELNLWEIFSLQLNLSPKPCSLFRQFLVSPFPQKKSKIAL